jgi:site-specific recombinase XerD
MKQPLARPTAALVSQTLDAAQAAAKKYAQSSRAASTWRAYESDWRIFKAWCAQVALNPIPAEPRTVALFLAAEAQSGLAPSTLDRRLAAIRLMHRGARVASPHDALEVLEVLSGIRRDWRRPAAQKAPALDEQVKQMVDAVTEQTLKGLRDRALLLLGFAGAFRRSELVALDVAHLIPHPKGLCVLIAHSKTDQEGQGQTVAIARIPDSPYCPVQAIMDWLVVAQIPSGPLFRRLHRHDVIGRSRLTAQSVALVVKDLALRVGLDPSRYAGHSLRSGFLTSAARARASIFKMADQSRHRSLDTLREYVRAQERFEDHAGASLLRGGRARPVSRLSRPE